MACFWSNNDGLNGPQFFFTVFKNFTNVKKYMTYDHGLIWQVMIISQKNTLFICSAVQEWEQTLIYYHIGNILESLVPPSLNSTNPSISNTQVTSHRVLFKWEKHLLITMTFNMAWVCIILLRSFIVFCQGTEGLKLNF